MAIRLDHLARRIPFRLALHLSADTYHSSRYTCKRLALGAVMHVFGKTDAGGYFQPTGKVTKSVYRESAKSDDFETLTELLRACPGVARQARKLFGCRKRA